MKLTAAPSLKNQKLSILDSSIFELISRKVKRVLKKIAFFPKRTFQPIAYLPKNLAEQSPETISKTTADKQKEEIEKLNTLV